MRVSLLQTASVAAYMALAGFAAAQPSVTTNPTNQTIAAGANASFTAAASGTPTPTVQWQVSTDGNGVTFNDIPGATSGTYTFATDPTQNGNQYRAVFTNTGGSTASSAATLTVTGPMLAIEKTHVPGTFIVGNTMNLARWYLNVSNIGTQATSGTVNVVDFLPSGYTLVGPYGTDWTCGVSPSTLSCASADTINPGAILPTLGVIVNVPVNSPATVQNTATASGGGTASSVNSNTDIVIVGTALSSTAFAQQGPEFKGTSGSTIQLGYSVAISADGNTAIAGAPTGGGGTWVWTRSGGVWTQQGPVLVGTGQVNPSGAFLGQGTSVALSADGNTALVGGPNDKGVTGAAWVWTRSGGVWTQQGPKLVASDAVGAAQQGTSVALSADGNMALIGAPADNRGVGAAWVWTRSGNVWTQQGLKLVGTGARGHANQGSAVALSADGNSALVGGSADHGGIGAVWVWTRSNGVWTQQGPKLVGAASSLNARQGFSLALSGDGNTAIEGGYGDFNGVTGAAWVWTRSGGVWTQQGSKLVVASGIQQGFSVSLSGHGNMALVGSPYAYAGAGAALVWTRSGGVWMQQPDLVGNGTGQELQGHAVALSADASTAMVGASWVPGGVYFFAAGQPSIITHPTNQTVNVGSNATFTATANGITPLMVHWQVSSDNGLTFTDISGATSNPYTFAVNLSQNGYQYRAVFTNSVGSVTSTPAVLTVTTPTLSIRKSHSGNFAIGQQNATYTVLVTNGANSLGATFGTVTVTDTLPAGLTLVSMAGSGWTCPGTAANNCTRSDALNPGATYPPITVTVNVALNAPSQVSNQVGVSGGSSRPNSWVDPTIIESVAGDFGGTGVSDILLQFPDGSMGVWYMNATGQQLAITAFAFLAGPSTGIKLVDTADLNGDGVPDLLLQFPDGSTGVWYMGGPQRTTITGFAFLHGPIQGWAPVGAADLNGDGSPDLIIQYQDGTAGVWYLGGTGGNQILGFSPLSGPIPGWNVVGAADLNADGHPDIVLQRNDGLVGVWYMTGAQGNQIQGFAIIAGPSSWQVVGVADMNRDGIPDLIIRNTDGTLGVWFLGGAQGNQITGFTLITTPGNITWRELAAH